MENNSVDTTAARAALFKQIRAFFDARQSLEVATPCLTPDTAAEAGVNTFSLNADTWLRASPEYEMKRLLARHKRDIYQLGPVFRDDPAGRKHHREFTMLEWYRLGFDYRMLMDEVDDLLRALITLSPVRPRHDLPDSSTHIAWHDLLMTLGIDGRSVSDLKLAEHCKKHGWHHCDSRCSALDFLTDCAARELDARQPAFVYDYPEELAQFAVMNNGVAERFEVYLGGMELFNGCSELTDPRLCRQRCNMENNRRIENGRKQLSSAEITTSEPTVLFEALDSGLPPCAGASLGVDRLLMYITGAGDIREVL